MNKERKEALDDMDSMIDALEDASRSRLGSKDKFVQMVGFRFRDAARDLTSEQRRMRQAMEADEAAAAKGSQHDSHDDGPDA